MNTEKTERTKQRQDKPQAEEALEAAKIFQEIFTSTNCQDHDQVKQLITYKKNIRALKKYHPIIYGQLQKRPITTDALFKTDLHLNASISKNNQTQHIHLNIHDEIAPALQHLAQESHAVVCFIGAGLGYPLMALKKARPNIQRFILIEPLLEILQLCLMATDIYDLLSDPRVILIAGNTPIDNQTISTAVQPLQFEDCYLYKHNPTWHLSEMYQQQAEQMYMLANGLNTSGSTMIAMGHMFMKNRFANLSMMAGAKSLTATQGLCKNTTTVLITAGPSLDKNIHVLKDYQDSICIICADSAFPTLLKHQIRPDFVTSLDPQNMVFEKLSSTLAETAGTNLICNMGVCPKIPKYFPFKQVFFSFNGSNIESSFAKLAESKIETSPSDASPHLSLHAAIMMEAPTIIFIGHDLAYTDEKSHAKNTAIPTDLKTIGADKQVTSPDIHWTQDIHGNDIKTTRSFLNSKTHFEEIIKNNPGNYINATEGGIGIKGSKNMPLALALEQIHPDQNWHTIRDNSLEQIKTINITAIATYLAKIKKDIQQTLKSTTPLLHVLKNLSTALSKTKLNSYEHLNKKQKKLLIRHDRLNTEIHKDMSLFNLVDEITVKGVRDSNRRQTAIQQIPEKFYGKRLKAILSRSKATTESYATALRTVLKYSTLFLEFHENTREGKSRWEQAQAHIAVDNITRAKILFDNDMNLFAEKQSEFHLYQGYIAAKQLKPTEMHLAFKKACQADPALQQEITQFKHKMQDDFLEELYYSFPAIKEKLTLRLLNFWGDTGTTEPKLCNFLKSHPSLSPAHDMMAKKEVILASISEGHHTYAKQQIEEDKHDEAIKTLDKAISFDPTNDKAQMTIVQEYFDTGNFSQAVHHLEQAVQLNPSHAENWQTIGDYLFSQNQFTDARLAYENNYVALPENSPILLKVIKCYSSDGDVAGAQRIQTLYDTTQRKNQAH